MKPTDPLCCASVKALALDQARRSGRPFERVSRRFIEELAAQVRATIAARVHSAPGRKTL